jgi:hypothetical protein
VDKTTKVADYVEERKKQSQRAGVGDRTDNRVRKIDGAASSFSCVQRNGSNIQTKKNSELKTANNLVMA